MSTPPSYRDSYASSDYESVNFKAPKQVAGPEFYDRSNFSRQVGFAGVAFAALVGGFCIFGGSMIYLSKYTISSGIIVVPISNNLEKELLSLALNLLVTICTEATGFVHGIAVRSALASQRRLRFNTNLRLLSTANGWFSPNGFLWNGIMAILLIVSYSSSLLLALSVDMGPSNETDGNHIVVCVSEVPLFVLGVTLLTQVIITMVSVRTVTIRTWSSSPFDLTAALVHHTQVIREPERCMRGVCDNAPRGPVKPSPKQPSAWRAHPSIRKVLMTLWALVVICMIWGLVIAYIPDHDISENMKSWSFLPQRESHVVAYLIPLSHSRGAYWYWALYYASMALIQGPLTLALHCTELIVNVIRDERQWRKATGEGGTTIAGHPLAPVFGSPMNVALVLAKPLLHWMLGLAISLSGTAKDELLMSIAVTMWPSQVLNYAGALLVLSLVFTVVAFIQPKGPQPAAYGHVQTLANLIDEWPPTMWWGDKGKGLYHRHAGTSDYRLSEINMDALYA